MLSFKEIQEKIEREIGQLEFDCPPKSLYEPITYILSLGGKRIRPALVLMAYNLYREDVEKAIRPAIGLEVFHNFTLLHDDLMDQADKRRNKPTKRKQRMRLLRGQNQKITKETRTKCKVRMRK